MPAPTLNMSSPFECLYHHEPPIDMLRVFRCAYYPLMTLYRADKLQPKTTRCVFIGFANGYKGYICYNLVSRKYIISRHVFFEETMFPYASAVPSQSAAKSTSSLAQHISSTQVSSLPYDYTQSTQQKMLSSILSSQSGTPLSSQYQLGLVVLKTQLVCLSTHLKTMIQAYPLPSHLVLPQRVLTLVILQIHPYNFKNLINGDISIQTQPGVGSIYVVLDCAPVKPSSQISCSNILHHVASLIDVPHNAHTMLTRGKRGILKKTCYLSILSQTTADPNDTKHVNPKIALTVPVWKQAMQEEFDALQHELLSLFLKVKILYPVNGFSRLKEMQMALQLGTRLVWLLVDSVKSMLLIMKNLSLQLYAIPL